MEIIINLHKSEVSVTIVIKPICKIDIERKTGSKNKFTLSVRRIPFDWKTPQGYLIVFIDQCAACYFLCLSCTSIMCFAIGTCMMITSILRDIANDLSLLNEPIIFNARRNKMAQQFYDIIQLHCDAKQLSDFQLFELTWEYSEILFH